MSDRKLMYEVAADIKDGKLTLEDAMATWGHIVDRDELLDVLDSLEKIEIVDNEDDTITFRVPEPWGWGERIWSEEDDQPA